MKRDVIEEQMRPASAEYGVASLSTKHSPKMAVCHKPCAQCPWRKDVPTGVFPAEAYRLSAPTAYDTDFRRPRPTTRPCPRSPAT